jgi:hypothetical protein
MGVKKIRNKNMQDLSQKKWRFGIFPEALWNHIAAPITIPANADNVGVITYSLYLQQWLLKKGITSIKAFRGFSSKKRLKAKSNIFPEDILISFSENPSAAMNVAYKRSGAEEWAYTIAVEIPVSRIRYHHKADSLAPHLDLEKEITAFAHGLEFTILNESKPGEKMYASPFPDHGILRVVPHETKPLKKKSAKK